MAQPKPTASSPITLPEEIRELTEKLAASAHAHPAPGRMREDRTCGPPRNDELKPHPGLVPYDELTESKKKYNRTTALETLRAICAPGYRITRD